MRARDTLRKHDAASLAELISGFLRTVGEASSTEVNAFLHRNCRHANIVAAMAILHRDHRVAVRKVKGAFRNPKTLWRSLEPRISKPPQSKPPQPPPALGERSTKPRHVWR